MADYVTKIRTEAGDKQIDYEALANLPQSDATLTKSGEFADAKSVGDALKQKADKTSIPTKLSELENDSGFLSEIPTEYVTEDELAEQGYLTETQLNEKGYVTETALAEQGYLKEVPAATTETIGGVKPGDGLVVSDDGTLSLDEITWENVVNKPEAFPPSEHTHVLEEIRNIIVCETMPTETEIVNGNWYLVKVEG
jgi:hypothetical protein